MKGKESKSKRTRAKVSKPEAPAEEAPKAAPAKKVEKMSLSTWTSLMISAKKLRPEQRREIEIFMKKQNLSEMEEKEKFDKAYSRF